VKFFGKFLFEGRYLAFFKTEKTNEIPVFYIKMLDIESVEDGFNQVPTDFFVEYLIPGSMCFKTRPLEKTELNQKRWTLLKSC
jgi:hypothetical protein